MRIGAILRMLAMGALAWLMVLPATAGAFPLTGSCSLTLTSTDAKGAALDTAKSGDGSASESDPLLLDWEGTVTWNGTATIALQDNSYHLEMFGIPTPFRGASANTGDARSSAGTFAFKANAPIRFTGLYYITGGIKGSGGTCEGSFVVKLVGDPITTVPFLVSLALLLIGGLLAVWGFGGHLVAALFGGLILGFGIALLLVVWSFLPVGAVTPVVALVLGVVLGAVAAVTGRIKVHAKATAIATAELAAPIVPSVSYQPPSALAPDLPPAETAPLLLDQPVAASEDAGVADAAEGGEVPLEPETAEVDAVPPQPGALGDSEPPADPTPGADPADHA